MASILEGYSHDVFISYRQNDNRSGWVTQFVHDLEEQLAAASKVPVSVYFDQNPHAGIGDTHDVDESLRERLRCVVFVPILSQTYCDPKSFAWQHEFLAFKKTAHSESLGLKVKLSNGNVSSRIVPVCIHRLDAADKASIEEELGPLRAVDLVFEAPGVNRPLVPSDKKEDNLSGLQYRNQVNKVANAIKEILVSASTMRQEMEQASAPSMSPMQKVGERGLIRAAIAYALMAFMVWRISAWIPFLSERYTDLIGILLIAGFPLSIFLAWKFERSPSGFVRIGSNESISNPWNSSRKKPLTSNQMLVALGLAAALLIILEPPNPPVQGSEHSSIAVIPFVNATGNPEFDYYGSGLASEVRTRLALSKKFDFISAMMATAPFRGTTETPQAIGERLNVTHLVSGEYQGTKDDLLVNVEMMEASTGRMVWTFKVRTRVEDVFAFQARLADQVMKQFDVQASGRPAMNTSIEAFASYSKGVELNRLTHDYVRKLTYNPYFREAIRLDSSFLPAWKELIGNLAFHFFNDNRETTVLPEIERLMTYVNTHFEESWEKKELQAMVAYWVYKDFKAGEELFLEVLDENPDAEYANALLAALYRRQLNFSASLKYRMRRLQLAPDPQVWRELGILFSEGGDMERAEKALAIAAELNPEVSDMYYFLNRMQGKLETMPEVIKRRYQGKYQLDLYFQQLNFAAALRFLDSARFDPDEFGRSIMAGYRAIAHYELGNMQAAKKQAREFVQLCKQDPIKYEFGLEWGFHNVAVYAIAGEPHALFETNGNFEKQLQQDYSLQIWIAVNKLVDKAMRKDYEGVTKDLRDLNRRYPKFGNYLWLNEPYFEIIKREYPPFREAINSLNLPPKLDELEIVKF